MLSFNGFLPCQDVTLVWWWGVGGAGSLKWAVSSPSKSIFSGSTTSSPIRCVTLKNKSFPWKLFPASIIWYKIAGLFLAICVIFHFICTLAYARFISLRDFRVFSFNLMDIWGRFGSSDVFFLRKSCLGQRGHTNQRWAEYLVEKVNSFRTASLLWFSKKISPFHCVKQKGS